MTELPEDEESVPDGSGLPEEIDAGPSPSVLQRIGEVTGSKPRVLLRDESTGATPTSQPFGSDERARAGKYVVQGELGHGGVGTVHKGHDQDLGRDVAMKFLHERYKDDAGVLHRFVEEAQIGGQLQHPGIVPVYDLGMMDGRPFFAMKLVKGQTLAKQLAERSSPAEDRRSFLAIFEAVCQTVAYAHARGVVHRDLKPANIMIGSFGEVQVVDWGMGKVLPAGGVADEQLAAEPRSEVSVIETVRSSGHGTQSIVGSVMGTPAYMPPEQARGDVDAMDERSDVFALGAILCEVLTGQPPYVGDTSETIVMAAMAKLDDAYARLGACDAEPEMVELARRCLMPAPAARPRTAEVIARAVHDHLAAVEARVHEARVEAAEAKVRAAALKRTQALGISLTAVIAAGLAISLWFWRAADAAADNERVAKHAAEESARNERVAKLAAEESERQARANEQRAVEQTAIAERELARAVEIKTLITDMLQSVRPEEAQGADTRLLRGILDTASERLASGAIEDELVAAELHGLIGYVYWTLGNRAEADQHLPVALEVRERVLGAEHSRTLWTMNVLAALRVDQGRSAEAVELGEKILAARMRALGEEHPKTLTAMFNLASEYKSHGDPARAEKLLLRTLELRERLLGEEHPDTLRTVANLALVYSAMGRYADAGQLQLRAAEKLADTLGESHPETIVMRLILAGTWKHLGRYADAEPLLRRAIEAAERVLGAGHANTLRGMLDLSLIDLDLGRYAEAESVLQRALENGKRTLGEEDATVLELQNALARTYKSAGRYAEAEELYLHTLEIQKRMLGDDHSSTTSTVSSLGLLYQSQGRHAEAEPFLVRSLERDKQTLGEEHPFTLGSITNLANNHNSMGRYEEAAALFEVCLPLKRRILGPKHAWTSYARDGLITAYLGMGRPEDALPLQRESFEAWLAPANEPDASAAALNQYAWVLLTYEVEALRDPAQAMVLARRACEQEEAAAGTMLWAYLDTLALAQHRTGDTAAAVTTQRRALDLMPEGADDGVSTRLADYEAALEGTPRK